MMTFFPASRHRVFAATRRVYGISTRGANPRWYRPSSSLKNAVGKVRGIKVTPSLSNLRRSSFSESHRLL